MDVRAPHGCRQGMHAFPRLVCSVSLHLGRLIFVRQYGLEGHYLVVKNVTLCYFSLLAPLTVLDSSGWGTQTAPDRSC